MNDTNEFNRLVVLLQGLEAKKKEINREVDEQIKAVQTTMQLLGNGSGPVPRRFSRLRVSSPYNLKGLTQVEALAEIAKNEGSVKIKNAREPLEKAGVLKKTKNWYNILYTVIRRSGRFEHVGPGEYKLIPLETREIHDTTEHIMRLS